MNEIYNNRYDEFKKYCLDNIPWIDRIPIPHIKQEQIKETVFIELRCLPHIYFILRNAIRVLGNEWSHTVICGEANYNFILDIKRKLGRDIRIIKLERENLTRLEYSIMLLKSSFWSQFYGKYILIHQEDSIIFKKIPNFYFKYDYVGAPFFNKKIGNGGFSLRNKETMINICKKHYDLFEDRIGKSRHFLEQKIEYLVSKNIDYKNDRKFIFLYNIEKNLLEDVLLCNKIQHFPSFVEAQEFSVEKYFFKNPVGGHQFWYAVKDINKWLNFNLKNVIRNK